MQDCQRMLLMKHVGAVVNQLGVQRKRIAGLQVVIPLPVHSPHNEIFAAIKAVEFTEISLSRSVDLSLPHVATPLTTRKYSGIGLEEVPILSQSLAW